MLKELDQVKVVKDLNKRLQYQNCHQQCILDQKTGELTTLRQELLDTKIKVKVEPEKVKQREEDLTREIKQLQCQNSQLEEDHQTLFTDCDSWKHKYWDGLKRVNEAHRLLNVHLHNAAQYRDDYLAEVEKKKLVQDKLDATLSELADVIVKAEKCQEDYKTEKEAWTDETVKLRNEIEDVHKQLDESKEECKIAEEKLEKSSIYTVELEHKLSDAQAILNVDKLNVESQTDLQMLAMLSCGTQVSPDTQCKEVQVEGAIETKFTQTIDPSYCSEESQTDSDTKVHKDVASQVAVETTQQGIQTDDDVATSTTTLVYGVKDIQPDKVKTADKSLCKAQNEQTSYGKVSDDYMSQNVVGSTSIGTDIVRRDFPEISDPADQAEGVEESKEVLKGITIIISDSEDEPSLNNGEKDGDKNNGERYEDETNNATTDGNQSVSKDIEVMGETDIKSDGNVYDKETNAAKGGVHTQSFHQGTEVEGPVTDKKLANIYIDQVKHIGLKIPNINVKTVVGNVPVDPEEFSIALSQENSNKATDRSHSFQTDMSVNKKLVCSGSGPVLYSRNSHETDDIENPQIDSNWQVLNEPPKLFKPKSRKHKLSKDTVDEHFSIFNMRKSMFESSANDEEENAFQAKQPKLNKTKQSANVSQPPGNKKVRQFSSMFQKSPNVSGNAGAEQIEKQSNVGDSDITNDRKRRFSDNHNPHHSHLDPEGTPSQTNPVDISQGQTGERIQNPINYQLGMYSVPGSGSIQTTGNEEEWKMSTDSMGTHSRPVTPSQLANVTTLTGPLAPATYLPVTAESTIPFTTTTPSDQPESLSLLRMSGETTSGRASFTAASSNEPVSLSERSHIYQTNYDCTANTNTRIDQKGIPCTETTNYPATDSDRVTTSCAPTTCDASRTTNKVTVSSFTSQGPTQPVIKTTGTVLDKSTSKSRGNADFLQKYRDIVANLKRPNTSNVAQEQLRHSTVYSMSHSNNSVLAKNNVSQGNSGLLPSNTSGEKQDASLNETVVNSPGTTPGGILKGIRRKRKPSRNVTWSKYVAHKEFITQSASDESSQDTS